MVLCTLLLYTYAYKLCCWSDFFTDKFTFNFFNFFVVLLSTFTQITKTLLSEIYRFTLTLLYYSTFL